MKLLNWLKFTNQKTFNNGDINGCISRNLLLPYAYRIYSPLENVVKQINRTTILMLQSVCVLNDINTVDNLSVRLERTSLEAAKQLGIKLCKGLKYVTQTVP